MRFKPAGASATSLLATSTTTVAPAAAAVGAPRTATPTHDTSARAATTVSPAARSTDGGIAWESVLRVAGLTLLGLLAVAFVLRRRAVKRQRSRRIERQRALAEARRRRMIDVVEPDEDGDVRVVPTRTTHHVAATGRRRASDRKVVRPTRPRDHSGERGRS